MLGFENNTSCWKITPSKKNTVLVAQSSLIFFQGTNALVEIQGPESLSTRRQDQYRWSPNNSRLITGIDLCQDTTCELEGSKSRCLTKPLNRHEGCREKFTGRGETRDLPLRRRQLRRSSFDHFTWVICKNSLSHPLRTTSASSVPG